MKLGLWLVVRDAGGEGHRCLPGPSHPGLGGLIAINLMDRLRPTPLGSGGYEGAKTKL
jgi:hypothetical protein